MGRNYDYTRMTKKQLIQHCRAYSKAIHKLANELQTRIIREKKREQLIEAFGG